MADSRAMEEQNERYNPINPKSELMKNYTGMGATPSMGLSEYRGGDLKDYLSKKLSKKVSDIKSSVLNYLPDTFKKAQASVKAKMGGKKHTLIDHLEHPNKGFGKMSEAHMMGQHLSKHIHDLHGAGFWSDFGQGFKQGFTGTLDALKPATAFIPGFNEVADAGRSVVGWGHSEEQRAMEQMSKKRVGRSRNKSDIPLLSGNVDGVRGGANTGAYEGHGMLGQDGHGMRKKRMVGAGVKARADLVKKVMAEKGMKMIEASKYVKEHNLYHK